MPKKRIVSSRRVYGVIHRRDHHKVILAGETTKHRDVAKKFVESSVEGASFSVFCCFSDNGRTGVSFIHPKDFQGTEDHERKITELFGGLLHSSKPLEGLGIQSLGA